MTIVEKEGHPLQDRSYRQHLNRNWDNINGFETNVNRQIKQVLSNPPVSSADEVTQLRIDVDGNEYPQAKVRVDTVERDAKYALKEVRKKVSKNEAEQVSWLMLAQDAKEQIAQNKTAVVGPNSVANLNLTNKAVTASKTTFMTIGKNLFNKDSPDIVYGKFAYYDNGKVTDNDDYFMSGFLEKTNSGKLTINTAGKAVHMCFYDSNLNFISGTYKPNTFEYPTIASFMRLSANLELIDKIQIELGSVATSYENYVETFNEEAKNDLVKSNNLIKGHPGINLFNPNEITIGAYPYFKSGLLQDNPDYYASSLIPVIPAADYFLKTVATGIHLCYYDSNKKFIVGVTSSAALGANRTPDNARFIRFGAPMKSLSDVMFYQGADPVEYEAYTIAIDEDNLLPSTNARLRELEDGASTKFDVLIPSTIYVTANEQTSFYYYNIINNALAFEKGNYGIRFQKNNGGSYEKFGTGLDYMYYFDTNKDIILTVKIFDDNKNKELYSKDISVKVKTPNTEPINIFWIGDSYSDGFGLVQNTFDLLKDKGQTVNFLGTRQSGTETVHHNATGGARINNFFKPKIAEEVNPLYNPDTKTFDYSYFMTSNFPDTKADIFVIALGINDITRYATDSSINGSMGLIKQVIDSVYAYDPAIKILIRTINPQAQVNVRWENSYESNFMRAGRMKLMQERWNTAVLNNFDGTIQNVAIMHDGASLDTRFGLNTEIINPVKFMPDYAETATKDTHPNDVGSKQLADVICGYIV
ncbi:SGNH/GDSL hydrolase family protein [Latilactobacillus sakei]|uniref:SGNH/GDSL hydrolase family protein n=1 Tax=Latilactobacillus sakei TaxID=1599 RepID=UPI0024DF6B07|nr:SGNH/GDSL hydrolase family protein [Latilactobacillus sakei]